MLMRDQVKVLYCAFPTLPAENGGSIVCRQNIERLSEVANCRLHVCTINDKSVTSATNAIVKRFGADFHPIEFTTGNSDRNCFFPLGRQWPFPLEQLALDKARTDSDFFTLMNAVEPDIVIVDYLLTALFVPSLFNSNARIITITINREAQFFGQLRRLNRIDGRSSNSMIAEARLRRFEREVYERSDAVVALSAGDIPSNRQPGTLAFCIEPALNDRTQRWQLTESNHLLFVGNINHYPNYLAIQWLAQECAPELLRIAPELRINIIGAATNDIPLTWRQPNVEYLGLSTKEEVERQMQTCRLFIAPIENTFGSKIKILECLAHGTPTIASPEALSGIPFSDQLPQFLLTDPTAAAHKVAELARKPCEVARLSDEITRLNRDFSASRKMKWSELLTSVKVRPKVPRENFGLLSPSRRTPLVGVDTSRPWPRKFEVGVKEPIGVSSVGWHDVERFKGFPLRWSSPTASNSSSPQSRHASAQIGSETACFCGYALRSHHLLRR